MNPEERAYKILQDSNFVRYPEDEGKVEAFLSSIEGISWENPTDKIQERIFETSLKSFFPQYTKELEEFANNNASTLDGQKGPFMNSINLHTVDDQGFGGQVMGDGFFCRWMEFKTEQRPYKDKSDLELESMWQAQSNMIQTALTKAYNDETDKTESDRCMELAETAQKKQSLIQAEITRRAK